MKAFSVDTKNFTIDESYHLPDDADPNKAHFSTNSIAFVSEKQAYRKLQELIDNRMIELSDEGKELYGKSLAVSDRLEELND